MKPADPKRPFYPLGDPEGVEFNPFRVGLSSLACMIRRFHLRLMTLGPFGTDRVRLSQRLRPNAPGMRAPQAPTLKGSSARVVMPVLPLATRPNRVGILVSRIPGALPPVWCPLQGTRNPPSALTLLRPFQDDVTFAKRGCRNLCIGLLGSPNI